MIKDLFLFRIEEVPDDDIIDLISLENYEEMLREEIWIQKFLLIEQSKQMGVMFAKSDFSLSEIQIFTELSMIMAKKARAKARIDGKSKVNL